MKKIDGYVIIPKNFTERVRCIIADTDHLPRARTVYPDREDLAFAAAIAGLPAGIYRVTLRFARPGQSPGVKVTSKPVKLVDEIAMLERRAKPPVAPRAQRVRASSRQSEGRRLAGIRARALADTLRATLARSVEQTPAAPKATQTSRSFLVYRDGPDGAPIHLATAASAHDVAAFLRTHGLEAAVGRVYAIDTANELKLTLAVEVR